jgi:hypothetical protein
MPAYCDRILWRRNPHLKQIRYFSVNEVNFSDHRPVIAHFQLNLNSSTPKYLEENLKSQLEKLEGRFSKL